MSSYTISYTVTADLDRFEFWSGAKDRMDDATDEQREPKKRPSRTNGLSAKRMPKAGGRVKTKSRPPWGSSRDKFYQSNRESHPLGALRFLRAQN